MGGFVMKLELINNQSQLIENAKRLHSYRAGVNREFYENLIARGATFIVVQIKDDFIFAPSRFVGYIKIPLKSMNTFIIKTLGLMEGTLIKKFRNCWVKTEKMRF